MPGTWCMIYRLGSRAMGSSSSSIPHFPMLRPCSCHPEPPSPPPQAQHPAWTYVPAFAHTAPSTGNTLAHPPLPRGYSQSSYRQKGGRNHLFREGGWIRCPRLRHRRGHTGRPLRENPPYIQGLALPDLTGDSDI